MSGFATNFSIIFVEKRQKNIIPMCVYHNKYKFKYRFKVSQLTLVTYKLHFPFTPRFQKDRSMWRMSVNL